MAVFRAGSPSHLLRVAVVLGLAGLGSCNKQAPAADAPDGSSTSEGAPTGPASRADALAAFADAIDPGPQEPLLKGLPAWAVDIVGLAKTPTSAEGDALVQQTLDGLAGADPASLWSQPGALVAIARSLAVMESRVAKGGAGASGYVALASLYAIIDHPILANENSFFSRMIPTLVEVARAAGGDEDIDEIEGMAKQLQAQMMRAGPLRRHALANLLRTAPDDERVSAQLTKVAPSLAPDNPALALQAAQLALRFASPQTATHHADVAYRCYTLLDLEGGDAALADATTANTAKPDPKIAARLESLAQTRATAQQAADAEGSKALDAQLRYTAAMVELERYKLAKPLLDDLAKSHPTDARVMSTLARLYVARDLDTTSAHALVTKEGLDHKEAGFYELAIGLRATQLFYEILPKLAENEAAAAEALKAPLAKLRADVEAYEKLGADVAVVLHALLDIADRIVPLLGEENRDALAKEMLGAIDLATPLYKRVPKSTHAYILVMSAAELMRDKATAIAAAKTPPPKTGDGVLLLRQSAALLNLALTWDDPAIVLLAHEALNATAAAGPERGPDENHPLARQIQITSAHILALQAAFTGELGYANQAVQAYYPLFEHFRDPMAINNMAVLLWEMGEHDQAREAVTTAVSLAPDDNEVAAFNQLVLQDEASGNPALEALALDESKDTDLRRLAMRWLAHRNEGAAKRRWEKMHNASKADATALRPQSDLPNRTRAVLKGRLQFNLGFSSKEGLALTIDAGSDPWLVLAPPGS